MRHERRLEVHAPLRRRAPRSPRRAHDRVRARIAPRRARHLRAGASGVRGHRAHLPRPVPAGQVPVRRVSSRCSAPGARERGRRLPQGQPLLRRGALGTRRRPAQQPGRGLAAPAPFHPAAVHPAADRRLRAVDGRRGRRPGGALAVARRGRNHYRPARGDVASHPAGGGAAALRLRCRAGHSRCGVCLSDPRRVRPAPGLRSRSRSAELADAVQPARRASPA